MDILIKLYKDQQTILEILISTYSYKKYDVLYYKNQLSEIKMFDTENYIDETLSYGKVLVGLVKNLRDLLFKIKIIINYPIMTTGTYVVMTEVYYRLKKDLFTGVWHNESEPDLFLLNKKLELSYGYEIPKVEANFLYSDFITELVTTEKVLFGRGLSDTEIKDLSNYIQVVEAKTIGEYDDFFMIPFWIDYLEKNV